MRCENSCRVDSFALMIYLSEEASDRSICLIWPSAVFGVVAWVRQQALP